MSLSDERKILLSQLVDGELPADQANEVLGDVLRELAPLPDDAEAARQLDAMLRLRRTLLPWRSREPSQPVATVPAPRHADRAGPSVRQVLSLASAVLLGGMMVAAGFALHGWNGGGQPAALARGPAVLVTPEQRGEIARAFALHESVVGPLDWYAADDATIQVAPAESGQSLRDPIAIVLRLTREMSSPGGRPAEKTYVIVCRNADAALELPQPGVAKTVRVRLLPEAVGGKVDLRFAIAADAQEPDRATLAGRRPVDLGQTPLGQLALDNGLVNVDASAWLLDGRTR